MSTWARARVGGQEVQVRPYHPPAHLMIESTITSYWEAKYADGVVRLVRESEIYFIS